MHVCRNARLVIHNQDQARLAQLWGILRDFRVVKALAIHSRNLFNYHCTDLIELYVNIAELQFAEVPTPAGQLNQLGIDLLQRILGANVEEYYDAALMDVEKDTWGPNLKTRESDAKIVFLHEFKECFIVLDGHFALEIVSKAHTTAAEITKLSKKVLQSITTLTKEARWTNKLYTEGVRFDYSDASRTMPCQNISATLGESPETDGFIAHHSLMNLRIIIYLLEYSMCLAILLHTLQYSIKEEWCYITRNSRYGKRGNR